MVVTSYFVQMFHNSVGSRGLTSMIAERSRLAWVRVQVQVQVIGMGDWLQVGLLTYLGIFSH